MFSALRNRIGQAALLVGLLAAMPLAHAQNWPAKPVRFIVPSVAGSSNDIAARTLAEQLARKWKQPVIIENKPGAGTVIGLDAVAKASPDGHTFGWATSAYSINPAINAHMPYDAGRDLAGVTLLYQLKPVIVVSPRLPVATLDEFIRYAKSHPGQLSYGSPATGSGPHILGELFKQKYGIDMQHIPYKGGASMLPDLLSGRVPVMFNTLPGSLPQIEAGEARLLAVLSDTPVPDHPEFPLLADLLPKESVVGWNGIVVPSATPRGIVKKLHGDLVEALRSGPVQDRLAALHVQPVVSATPEEFDAFLHTDIVRWDRFIKQAGIRVE